MNTLLYTQLITVEKDEQHTCKVAKTPKEIAELIKLGFEYVTDLNGAKFFRKRNRPYINCRGFIPKQCCGAEGRV